ncbi:uncharacterized protein LOC124373237 [Homalodisca vitripennis]|uniref:uncharacterized protein LOC124373237 n=1 Tax=Homalodisca vitripennis TaxID=197043 RepID=UPI001EE9F982|nr:uncharacterized protein LOC124373237 [Homalodisca vitripennis]
MGLGSKITTWENMYNTITNTSRPSRLTKKVPVAVPRHSGEEGTLPREGANRTSRTPSMYQSRTRSNVEKKVPYTVKEYVPQPYTVYKKEPLRLLVKVPVDKPYPVPRPQALPCVCGEEKYPYTVEKNTCHTLSKYLWTNLTPVHVPVVKHRAVHCREEGAVSRWKCLWRSPLPVSVPKPYPVYVEKKVPYTVEKPVTLPCQGACPCSCPSSRALSRLRPWVTSITSGLRV